MGTLALIGLGSNLGDRKAILDAAVTSLAETPGADFRAVSSYHETAPVGGPAGQGPFLNAAALVASNIEPARLLARLQEIESEAGRERKVRWGGRTLDLDLLLFGELVIGRHFAFAQGWRTPDQSLQIPHPHLPFRRFVLAPAAEVAPELRDPITRQTIGELLANLDRRPSYLAMPNGILQPSERHQRRFRGITLALHAAGWSRGNQSWIESDSRTWPIGVRIDDLPDDVRERRTQAKVREIRARGQELRADRWTFDLWDDRWIVTDDWFDLFLGPFDMTPSNETFWRIRQSVLEPTLVVLPRPIHKDIGVAINTGAFAGEGGWPIGGKAPPIYVPEATDVEGFVAEVVTLCAATR